MEFLLRTGFYPREIIGEENQIEEEPRKEYRKKNFKKETRPIGRRAEEIWIPRRKEEEEEEE